MSSTMWLPDMNTGWIWYKHLYQLNHFSNQILLKHIIILKKGVEGHTFKKGKLYIIGKSAILGVERPNQGGAEVNRDKNETMI